MLMILPSTHGIPCDKCDGNAVYLAVNCPESGFVSQLCPAHVGEFVRDWMGDQRRACERLEKRRPVRPEGT